MVLDENAKFVNTRIWYGYEQAILVQGKQLLLDFATVHAGKAQLLTEGLAAGDGDGTIFPSFFFLQIINIGENRSRLEVRTLGPTPHQH